MNYIWCNGGIVGWVKGGKGNWGQEWMNVMVCKPNRSLCFFKGIATPPTFVQFDNTRNSNQQPAKQ